VAVRHGWFSGSRNQVPDFPVLSCQDYLRPFGVFGMVWQSLKNANGVELLVCSSVLEDST